MAKIKKSVGDNIITNNASWSFSGSVARKFIPHIEKSVPLYNECHELILDYSDFFIKNGSVCYDIGCSNGNLLFKLSSHNSQRQNVKFIGLDVEKEMIKYASENFKRPNIIFKNKDFLKTQCQKSDFMVSFYTAQFVHAKDRLHFFQKIFEALNWGGAFLLFEKTRASDARFQDISNAVYNEFKLKKGFQVNEIFEKTRSLKGILDPFSVKGNIDLLELAGFRDISTIFSYITFTGWLIIK